MQSDLPHTLYKSNKEETKIAEDDPSIALNEASIRRMQERIARENAEREQSYTVDEIFSGLADNE